MKSYIKSKSGPNAQGPKFRTPDHFKGKAFSGRGVFAGFKFNPAQFRTQHKGG